MWDLLGLLGSNLFLEMPIITLKWVKINILDEFLKQLLSLLSILNTEILKF